VSKGGLRAWPAPEGPVFEVTSEPPGCGGPIGCNFPGLGGRASQVVGWQVAVQPLAREGLTGKAASHASCFLHPCRPTKLLAGTVVDADIGYGAQAMREAKR
jgi:hypothetical protein